MLFRSVCVLSLAASVPFASGQATYPRGAMWIFGDHGLSIYNTDGSKIIKSMAPEDFCPIDDEGNPECRSYNEIVSDYGKYAWTTANSRSGTNVEIFDLDYGHHVGSFPTCSGPRGFHFLPNRQEIWFRCTAPHTGDPDGESGYWDSFSTTSISSHFPEISLNQALPHSEETSYGQPVFLEERGIGYSSDYGNGVLHKVDLIDRVPLSNITIPNASGTWDMTYSPTNQHIFVKTMVCCTCGGPDKDLENCVEYRGGVHADPVIVLTGPSADPTQTQIGACGRFCDNSLADNIGVAEINTRTDTVVGYHKNSLGFGAASVYLSPNGDYVVLVSPRGAPANIRLVKPGANGQPSTLFKDIPIPTEGRLGQHTFVTSDIIAITGSDDKNELFLIEISTSTIYTVKLDTANINTDNGRGRMMKYIPGSSYLWVSATGPEAVADKFAYVVELNFEDWAATRVVRKVTGVDVNGLLFVENMKVAPRDHLSPFPGQHVNETNARVDALQQELQSLRSQLATATTSDGSPVQSSLPANVAGDGSSQDSKNTDALSITALVLGVVALVVSVVGFAQVNKKKPASTANTSTGGGKDDGSKEETTTAHPNEDLEKNSDFGGVGSDAEYSMGSKRDQYA